ncbi:hypothetical protein SPRG_14326 [Saprolegnia parasitica CBS 223.65]|uniref:C2 domain-containing protein n=1 Tax=Saprolegnia parasitica (strain CBS 223.65) TaxID=695850 RepID=A0A067BPK6_SAPPC|nr:hypothetical protein SPRG_14326 [Saprolegnia parasitica CBS 223.65]KDO20454.1 hypothetical protein SPRG_14326 [Saprolegnia parasitica CBS 223.65]|eukprot:XP_012208844.1 hypothetical protein SPRG_14326 [Saprolegnia parasitica CBS 223.65]
MAGRVRIRVQRARNLYDAQIFSKQDARVALTLGPTTLQTQVHVAGGTNPTWDEVLEFDDVGDELSVLVERPKEPKNDLLGSCTLSVAEWRADAANGKNPIEKAYPSTTDPSAGASSSSRRLSSLWSPKHRRSRTPRLLLLQSRS